MITTFQFEKELKPILTDFFLNKTSSQKLEKFINDDEVFEIVKKAKEMSEKNNLLRALYWAQDQLTDPDEDRDHQIGGGRW